MISLSRELYPRSKPQRLTFYYRRTGSPVWSPDGKSLLFARYETTGAHGIWRMDASNPSKMEPLPLSADSSSALALSAKGDRLIYTRETSGANIWGLEVNGSPRRGNHMRLPKKWISSSGEQFNPQFSPDGHHIAFQSTRSGYMEIWLADRDGSNPRQLSDIRAAITGFPRWSPDGSKIVFHSPPNGVATLFILDIRGAHPQPLMGASDDAEVPSWSQDGHCIYFASRRTGEMQVWKVPAKGGNATQVTSHGGWAPIESSDGRFLFYAKTGHGLWRLPVTGGTEQQLLPDIDAWGSAYTVRGRGIYLIGRTDQNSGKSLALLSFRTGRITPIATITQPIHLGLTASPNENLILYTQLDNVGSNLMIVDNLH
jgi:Tol biopolymer transport system component